MQLITSFGSNVAFQSNEVQTFEGKRVWFRRKKMHYQSFVCLFTAFRRTINKWRRLQSEQRESKTERVSGVRNSPTLSNPSLLVSSMGTLRHFSRR